MKLSLFAQVKWPGPTPNGASVYNNALTLTLGALGAASLIVIIYAGFRLITSRGNSDAIGKLRSTLLYAAIGLIISLSAGSIISFVAGRLG